MNEHEYLISVIIPVYNAKKFIATTINSVKKINNITYEIIIVNDGSTDNTRSVVESLNNDNIILVNKKMKVFQQQEIPA